MHESLNFSSNNNFATVLVAPSSDCFFRRAMAERAKTKIRKTIRKRYTPKVWLPGAPPDNPSRRPRVPVFGDDRDHVYYFTATVNELVVWQQKLLTLQSSLQQLVKVSEVPATDPVMTSLQAAVKDYWSWGQYILRPDYFGCMDEKGHPKAYFELGRTEEGGLDKRIAKRVPEMSSASGS